MGRSNFFICDSCDHELELDGVGRDRGFTIEVESCLCMPCEDVVDVVRRRWGDDEVEPTEEDVRRARVAMEPPPKPVQRILNWFRGLRASSPLPADATPPPPAEDEEDLLLEALETLELPPELKDNLSNLPPFAKRYLRSGKVTEEGLQTIVRILQRKDPEIDRCPRCGGAEVTPWNDPYACPKCHAPMRLRTDVFALWD